MSKEKADAKTEIKAEIRSVADIIKQNAESKDNGMFDLSASYKASLEEAGIEEKTVKQVQRHNSDFVAGASLALGELATEEMKKDKDLDRATAKIKMGQDTLALSFDRYQEVPTGNGESEKRWGVSNASVTVAAAGNKANLKTVRSHLSAMAEKALA